MIFGSVLIHLGQIWNEYINWYFRGIMVEDWGLRKMCLKPKIKYNNMFGSTVRPSVIERI